MLLGQDCLFLQQIVATSKDLPLPPMEGLQAAIKLMKLPLGEGELSHLMVQDPSLLHALVAARALK